MSNTNTQEIINSNVWPYISEDGKRWNVKMAEDDILTIKRFANMCKNPKLSEFNEDTLIPKLFPDYLILVANDAIHEMADIMYNKDNAYGYHINHITSGKTVYSVYDTSDSREYKFGGEFTSEAEAKAAVEKHTEDAYYEKDDTEDIWRVWVEDVEGSENLKTDNFGGEFVATFDTEEEAEAELEGLKYGYIDEHDAEEWFVVVNNETGKNAFNMMFPYELRALTFLYSKARPDAWMKYLETRKVRNNIKSIRVVGEGGEE